MFVLFFAFRIFLFLVQWEKRGIPLGGEQMKKITKISMQQNGERYNLFLDEEFFCGITDNASRVVFSPLKSNKL